MSEQTPVTESREQPVVSGDQPLAVFGADLTKEEFVSFALTAGRDPKKMAQLHRISLILTLVLILFCGYEVYTLWHMYGTPDWSSVSFLGLVIAVGLLSRFYWPALMRRRAEKQYENSLAMGHTYYGAVRVYARYVEKQTADSTTALLFNRETRYMEREDVIALGQPGSPALILYARYLTEEAADALRTAVFENVPPENCHLISRLCPLAKEAMPIPTMDAHEDDTQPMRITLRYTPEEIGLIFREMVYTLFADQLPLLSVVALLGGIALWLTSGDPVTGAGICAALMLITYLLRVVFPLQKNKKRLKNATPEELSCILNVSNKGIILSGKAQPRLSFPWKAITRAVSEPVYIRLYAGKTQVVIPKRCLEDVEAFCETVDRYMEDNPRGEE